MIIGFMLFLMRSGELLRRTSNINPLATLAERDPLLGPAGRALPAGPYWSAGSDRDGGYVVAIPYAQFWFPGLRLVACWQRSCCCWA